MEASDGLIMGSRGALTTKELAAYLRISPLTVKRMIELGTAPKHLRVSDRVTIFRIEDIETWMAARGHVAAVAPGKAAVPTRDDEGKERWVTTVPKLGRPRRGEEGGGATMTLTPTTALQNIPRKDGEYPAETEEQRANGARYRDVVDPMAREMPPWIHLRTGKPWDQVDRAEGKNDENYPDEETVQTWYQLGDRRYPVKTVMLKDGDREIRWPVPWLAAADGLQEDLFAANIAPKEYAREKERLEREAEEIAKMTAPREAPAPDEEVAPPDEEWQGGEEEVSS